jgi:AraC-like DNA-binding protein
MQIQSAFLLNVQAAVDAVPTHGKIRSVYLRGFKALVQNLGGDPLRMLDRHDIDPILFESHDHDIGCATVVNLFEYSSRSLHDPLFGLHLAEQQDPEVLGCAMTLARAAPTLRQAVQSLVDYVPLSTSPECELELVTARDVVELRWRTQTGFGDLEQVNYQGLLLFMKALRSLGREHFRPRYASLSFPLKAADVRLLEERLGCRVHGRAAANAIAFSSECLDSPIATADRVLFSLLGSCLPQLRSATRCNFIEQVEAEVRRELLVDGHCFVDGCAQRLQTSARTLQKRLTRMDVKFSDIVQKERIELAKQALLWSGCKLDEIAFQLGYAEQTTFGRAFKRATGLTPQAFRQPNRSH